MARLVPQCNVCALHASEQNALSMCSRCGVELYCSRDHQKGDFATHKRVCKRAKQYFELVAKEEAALRSAEPDMFMAENVFEEGVGHFWGIHETRSYMRAKYEVIRTMSVVATHASISKALAEAMDCLRLCRSDNMGECYDFCKSWATCDPDGRYDWGNLELPYLSIKDADMTEPLSVFGTEDSPFIWAALTFFKMTLTKEVGDAVNAQAVAESASLRGFLASLHDGRTRSLDELKALHAALQKQAELAFKKTHKGNAHYWRYVVDSMPLAREPDPGHYSHGDRFQIKPWIIPNAQLWKDATAFIKETATKQ